MAAVPDPSAPDSGTSDAAGGAHTNADAWFYQLLAGKLSDKKTMRIPHADRQAMLEAFARLQLAHEFLGTDEEFPLPMQPAAVPVWMANHADFRSAVQAYEGERANMYKNADAADKLRLDRMVAFPAVGGPLFPYCTATSGAPVAPFMGGNMAMPRAMAFVFINAASVKAFDANTHGGYDRHSYSLEGLQSFLKKPSNMNAESLGRWTRFLHEVGTVVFKVSSTRNPDAMLTALARLVPEGDWVAVADPNPTVVSAIAQLFEGENRMK